MTIAAAIALAASATAPAAAAANLDALDREVAAFTGAATGSPGGAVRPLDRRMRLRACQSGVSLAWHTPRRETVLLRCGDAGGWSLFVPVMAAGLAGQVSAQPAAFAVNRGDAVSLAITGRSFAVSRPAEALEAGAVGAWIRVRPVTDRKLAEDVVRARVERPGFVSLPAN
jgi:flagella basal body P-ring formation protein FlgA